MSLGYMLGAGMDGYMQGRKFKDEQEDRKAKKKKDETVDAGTQAVMDFLAAALGPPPNQSPTNQAAPQAQQGMQKFLAGGR